MDAEQVCESRDSSLYLPNTLDSGRTAQQVREGTARRDNVVLQMGAAEDFYDSWAEPTCIIVDGPYGVSGFPGDPPTHDGLADWYRPHIERWAALSSPQTTLWFWGTEIGWATVHPELQRAGWEYRACHIWDKGVGHIAGNANSATLRKFPIVTEVCVQYVKPARFYADGESMTMQQWLRHEWRRSGLPMYLANEACGVKNAATRKYLTACHLWYYPPVEAFVRMSRYVNKYGDSEGRPYFSEDGRRPISGKRWAKLRAKFKCEVGVTNVWTEPSLRGAERLKKGYRSVHLNQKPLRLIERVIRACTDPGDVVWEPFGGLCPGAVASHKMERAYFGAECDPDFFEAAARRLHAYERLGEDRPLLEE